MKAKLFFPFLTLSLITILCLPSTFAQDASQWSLPEGAKARLGKGTVIDAQYSSDGAHLVLAGSIGVWLYDIHAGKELDLLIGHTEHVSSVTYSPDGSTIASGGWDNTIHLWNTTTKQLKTSITGHTNGINSLAYSPDGNIIASGSFDYTVRLWSASTGQPRALIRAPNWVGGIAYAPDSSTIATQGDDGTILLWDTH